MKLKYFLILLIILLSINQVSAITSNSTDIYSSNMISQYSPDSPYLYSRLVVCHSNDGDCTNEGNTSIYFKFLENITDIRLLIKCIANCHVVQDQSLFAANTSDYTPENISYNNQPTDGIFLNYLQENITNGWFYGDFWNYLDVPNNNYTIHINTNENWAVQSAFVNYEKIGYTGDEYPYFKYNLKKNFTQYDIKNMTHVVEFPFWDTTFGNSTACDERYCIDNIVSGSSQIIFELPYWNTPIYLNIYCNINCEDNDPFFAGFYIDNLESGFDVNTVTMNTRPDINTTYEIEVSNETTGINFGWNRIYVPHPTQYMILLNLDSWDTSLSSSRGYFTPYIEYELPTYDPSGYVKDSLGTGIFNAKVQLSNSTWTDPCLSSCFSDANGYWNTNIYNNGTYNYNVSKNGYTTLTGSQAFTIGGVNNNFTLTASSGTMSGHIYTTSPSTGSVTIKGEVDSLKAQWLKETVFAGATRTVGSGWVIKVGDIDSAGGRALITILHDGDIIYADELVQKGQKYQYKINEDATQTTYIDVNVLDIFGGRETGMIQIDAGFESVRKFGGTITSFIASLLAALSGQTIMWNLVFYNLANLVAFTTDGSNQDYVTFNSSAGLDATGSYTFDTTSSGDIYNFYAIINAESSTSNAAKVEIGYTDDNILIAPGMTDTLYINNKQLYRGTTEDFKSLDANNDKRIKIWFTFKGGYSNFKLYEFYMNALGATTIKPLEGASIYFSATSNTLSGSLGEYQLPMTLGTNTIYFYKTGYESKNITHIFNTSYPSYSYDIVLNATNKTTNETTEYIYVNPDPVTIGTQAYALYKTLDKTNFILGGYQIAVCPLLSVSDCDKYDVPANTESSLPLNAYGIGEYTISLTGYKPWEVFRTTIVSNNFTVISSTPSIKWGTSPYYLGETMILSTYVPSGNSIVTIKYPNGSILFSNNYSASSLIYNTSFQTNSNISINQYPPGTYTATIGGGTPTSTQLLNQSVFEYSIDGPSSLARGLILNINYKSPRTSILYMTDSDGTVYISTDVSGTKTLPFNTSKLPTKATILNIKLLQLTNKLAEANVTISYAPTPTIGAQATNLMNVFTYMAFYGMAIFLGIFYSTIKLMSAHGAQVNGQALVIIMALVATMEALIGLFDPFKIYIIVITWIFAAIYFRQTRTTATGE